MAIPYEFIRVLEGKQPFFDESKRSPKEQAKYLLKNGNMNGMYLGACLDSCRWGSQTTVLYEMNITEMISFIRGWMRQNKDNFQNLWHERRIDELYKRFELPYINHESCHSNKEHTKTIRDCGGKLRCAQFEIKKFKPSFVVSYSTFDENAKLERVVCFEKEPQNPIHDDAYNKKTGKLLKAYEDDFNEYQKELEQFENEDKSFVVNDYCYSIISDKGNTLSLETILKRLTITPETMRIHCPGLKCTFKRLKQMSKEERWLYGGICFGHDEPTNNLEFEFMDGWNLASYTQKWYEQLPHGKSPWFDKDIK